MATVGETPTKRNATSPSPRATGRSYQHPYRHSPHWPWAASFRANTLWLSQAGMAELFQTSKQNVANT